MSADQRKCPYCGMAMAPDQKACPDCGNPYPFDEEPAPTAALPGTPPRGGRPTGGDAGGPTPASAPYRTVLVLVGVLVLIVAVGYLLFRVGMAFFEDRRPDPGSLPTATAGPVVVPPSLSASPAASPSPGPGTVISPAASPSPSGPTVRLKIANTEGQGANLRQRPSTTAPVLRTLADGTVVEAIGGETNAEGRVWRNVRDQGGATGWVAAELTAPE
jgi:hypothetical protein